MKNYLKQYLNKEEKNIDISMREGTDKTDKIDLRDSSVSFVSNRPNKYVKNQIVKACPFCNSKIRVSEHETSFDLECETDPLHYSEIRVKPGCKRLWQDVPLPSKTDDQPTLLFS